MSTDSVIPDEASAETLPVKKAPMVGTETFSRLGPKLRAAAEVVGRPVDDEKVIAWVSGALKKKTPKPTQSVWVEAPKAGFNVLFGRELANDAFPPGTTSSILRIDVKEAVGEDVLGVSWKSTSAKEVAAVLGPVSLMRSEFMNKDAPTISVWKRTLDSEGQVELLVEFDTSLAVSLVVPAAHVLRPFGLAAQAVFVGWAILRGLLDESRFPAHGKLISEVKKRKKTGADFVAAALPRGLWDDHLRDVPGLRRTAYQWFHTMNELSMSADFKEVFGPSLVSSGWDAVDQAEPKLKARFGKYL